MRVYVLPVLDVTVTLGCLCTEVDHVASEEKVVPRRDSHGVTHEGRAVTDKSCGHRAGDTVVDVLFSIKSTVTREHLRITRSAGK